MVRVSIIEKSRQIDKRVVSQKHFLFLFSMQYETCQRQISEIENKASGSSNERECREDDEANS
jgi:hypothetical protein